MTSIKHALAIMAISWPNYIMVIKFIPHGLTTAPIGYKSGENISRMILCALKDQSSRTNHLSLIADHTN